MNQRDQKLRMECRMGVQTPGLFWWYCSDCGRCKRHKLPYYIIYPRPPDMPRNPFCIHCQITYTPLEPGEIPPDLSL